MDREMAVVPLALEKLTGAKKAAIRKTASKAGISVEQYLANEKFGMKWCTDCESFVDQDYFYDTSSRGRARKHSYCKSCSRIRSKRANDLRLSTSEEFSKRETFPRDGDKKQARYRVNREVHKGNLPHAQTVACIDCGHVGSDKKHHYDHYLGYAGINHLAVECVCVSCHQKRERQRNQQPQGITMTVKQAIERLQKCTNPDAVVRIAFKNAENFTKNP